MSGTPEKPAVTPKVPKPSGGRSFQLWEYRVSHRQLLIRCLLIRCPKTNDSESNIDVMFFNVLYMGLPTTFHDIEFVAPAVKEVERLREGIGSIPEKRTVFMLKCGEHRHIILAGAVKVCTSDMDPFESPFELPPVVTS